MPPTYPGLEAPAHLNANPGLVLALFTATTIHHVVTAYTAEAKVKALRTLLTQTTKSYKESVEDLIKKLPDDQKNEPVFKDSKRASILLRG